MGYREIFIQKIIEHSTVDNYDDALEEFVAEYMDTADDVSECICTHPILYNFHLINKVNGCQIVVGSCCINKFGNNRLRGEVRVIEKESKRKTRPCKNCGKRVKKPNELCKHCEKNVKCCDRCQRYFLCQGHFRDFCTRCRECYNGRPFLKYDPKAPTFKRLNKHAKKADGYNPYIP